jgi:hypothetical protein
MMFTLLMILTATVLPAALVLTLTYTEIAYYLTQLACKVGLSKRWLPDEPPDFPTYLFVHWELNGAPGWIVHLLSCAVCLSWHTAFWTGLAVYWLSGTSLAYLPLSVAASVLLVFKWT